MGISGSTYLLAITIIIEIINITFATVSSHLSFQFISAHIHFI